jgi:hypothetical protein
MSVLLTNSTAMDPMELAFAQTFLVLAAGIYELALSLDNPWRYDTTVRKIGNGPFLFLMVCMLLYAVVVVVFTVIALSPFWRSDVRQLQAQLIP